MGAVRTCNEQSPIPAGVRSPRVQSHKADPVFLLFFSWVDPAVQWLLHHSKVEPTLTRSCRCPCSGDTSPAMRGVCCWCWCCCCYCCCCCCRPPSHQLLITLWTMHCAFTSNTSGGRQEARNFHSNPVSYLTKAIKQDKIQHRDNYILGFCILVYIFLYFWHKCLQLFMIVLHWSDPAWTFDSNFWYVECLLGWRE